MQDFYWFTVFVALNGLILFALTANVSRLRLKHKISWGDEGNNDLMKAIRTHANGTEQTPIYALAILSLSFINPGSIMLPILVVSFTLSRLIHAHGMLCNKPKSRRLGAVITYVSQAVAMIVLLVNLSV